LGGNGGNPMNKTAMIIMVILAFLLAWPGVKNMQRIEKQNE
jgi:hypothetical protein